MDAGPLSDAEVETIMGPTVEDVASLFSRCVNCGRDVTRESPRDLRLSASQRHRVEHVQCPS